MILKEKIARYNQESMIPPKLGEQLDLPTSPPTYDSDTQTQKSFIIYDKNPCYDNFPIKN
jgi:hypothetical protein